MSRRSSAALIAPILCAVIGASGVACASESPSDGPSDTASAPASDSSAAPTTGSSEPEELDIGALPTLEETNAQMLAFIDSIRVEIDGVSPEVAPWEWVQQYTAGGCTVAASEQGRALEFPWLISTALPPQEQWSELSDLVVELGTAEGFTVAEQRPDSTYVSLTAPDGRSLEYAVQTATKRDYIYLAANVSCRSDDSGFASGQIPLPPNP